MKPWLQGSTKPKQSTSKSLWTSHMAAVQQHKKATGGYLVPNHQHPRCESEPKSKLQRQTAATPSATPITASCGQLKHASKPAPAYSTHGRHHHQQDCNCSQFILCLPKTAIPPASNFRGNNTSSGTHHSKKHIQHIHETKRQHPPDKPKAAITAQSNQPHIHQPRSNFPKPQQGTDSAHSQSSHPTQIAAPTQESFRTRPGPTYGYDSQQSQSSKCNSDRTASEST
ncbi:hypothetical protein Nepgr_023047 [Nepenthes gracilis]|uniref:Uncharacterized protein n=1 Tax=Nepenthes gracilis TaxID=150966 RepID=A0AAD3T1Q9_NEPGR|nr:hypothetical protein Nepgr_023047 [Nepenthes gracilis]